MYIVYFKQEGKQLKRMGKMNSLHLLNSLLKSIFAWFALYFAPVKVPHDGGEVDNGNYSGRKQGTGGMCMHNFF